MHPDLAQHPRPGPSSSRPTFRLAAGPPFPGRVTSKVVGADPGRDHCTHTRPRTPQARTSRPLCLPATEVHPPGPRGPGLHGQAPVQLRLLPTQPRRAATVSIPSVGLPHESHWEAQAGGLNRPLGYGGLGAQTRPPLVAVAEPAGRSGASVLWGQVLSGQVSVKTVPKNHPEAPFPAAAGAPEVTPSLLGTGQIKPTPPRPSPPLGAWACL